MQESPLSLLEGGQPPPIIARHPDLQTLPPSGIWRPKWTALSRHRNFRHCLDSQNLWACVHHVKYNMCKFWFVYLHILTGYYMKIELDQTTSVGDSGTLWSPAYPRPLSSYRCAEFWYMIAGKLLLTWTPVDGTTVKGPHTLIHTIWYCTAGTRMWLKRQKSNRKSTLKCLSRPSMTLNISWILICLYVIT